MRSFQAFLHRHPGPPDEALCFSADQRLARGTCALGTVAEYMAKVMHQLEGSMPIRTEFSMDQYYAYQRMDSIAPSRTPASAPIAVDDVTALLLALRSVQVAPHLAPRLVLDEVRDQGLLCSAPAGHPRRLPAHHAERVQGRHGGESALVQLAHPERGDVLLADEEGHGVGPGLECWVGKRASCAGGLVLGGGHVCVFNLS